MAIPTIITPRQITDIRSSRLAIGGPYVLRATVLALLRFPMTSRGGENGFVLTGGAGHAGGFLTIILAVLRMKPKAVWATFKYCGPCPVPWLESPPTSAGGFFFALRGGPVWIWQWRVLNCLGIYCADEKAARRRSNRNQPSDLRRT
jgi:hypothetical protein